MLWKERSRIRAVQMNNLRGLLGIRRMDRVPNAHIKEMRGTDERIDEDVLQWFGCVERMENDGFAKIVYVGECAGSHSVGRPWKRWIDNIKECLRKRGLDVRQARRMKNKSKWCRFVRGNAWGAAWMMKVDTKTFADVGLLKDSSSIHLNTKPRTTQQHSLQMPYMLKLNHYLFPPDVTHSFPPT